MDLIQRLRQMIDESGRIVFLGGAGVSTESGVPDFRSENGVFAALTKYGYPPEILLSRSFFLSHTDLFFRYYKEAFLSVNAEPNDAHRALASLEKRGKLTAVITQNVDGLHQSAGSGRVLELHGSVELNFCVSCGRLYGKEHMIKSEGVPKCGCGAIIKPDVVLDVDGLDTDVLNAAITHITRADMLIVGGTSLTVYPAAGLVDYYRGSRLALINMGETARDLNADIVIREPIGRTLYKAVLEV